MEMQAFTQADHDAFAGAEGWGYHGTEHPPLVYHGNFADSDKEFVFVLDANGGCLVIEDDSQNDNGGYCLRKPFESQAEALDFARVLELERSHTGALALFRQLGE